jgi:hypothetical protein
MGKHATSIPPLPLRLLLVGSLSIGGCSDSISALSKSPGETVKAFYLAANAGKYSEAEAMLTQEARDFADGPLGQLAGGFKGVCDSNTKKGTISQVDVVSETIRGEGATVLVTIHFQDGTSKDRARDELILKDRRWQLTIGK